MPPTLEISVPTTSASATSPPYTLYNITLRLPLRSFTLSKRYSDFLSFHTTVTSQTTVPPPAPLPPKTWFANTLSNPTLREDRRKILETYLRTINDCDDPRWRTSSAWRAFLNLPNTGGSGAAADRGSSPSATATSKTTTTKLHAAITDPGSGASGHVITDPTLWLDCFRDMKAHLHDARLHLTRRDQETAPQRQHESSALAKSSLVRAGSLIGALDEGLRNLGAGAGAGGVSERKKGVNGDSNEEDSGRRRQDADGIVLGEGELRRRKDLLVNARKEKDGLEDLLNAMAAKGRLDSAVASMEEKEALVGNAATSSNSRKPGARSGRVLGKETERTRELDNQGVLQLQRETMEDQDLGLEELRKIVARQRELGVAINGELQVQSDLLKLADEDADRYVLPVSPCSTGI